MFSKFLSSRLCSFRLLRDGLIRCWTSTSGENDIESLCMESERKPGVSCRVHLIESESDWNNVFPALASTLGQFPVLGFDCEWPPKPLPDWSAADTSEKLEAMEKIVKKQRKLRDRVSLLQLATRDGTTILVRLNRLDFVPDSLRKLLEDVKCLKVGVEPTLDGRRLIKDYPTTFGRINGTLDVRYLLPASNPNEVPRRKRHFKESRTSFSLSDLILKYLDMTRVKRIRVACSDWAAPVLTPEQVQYAAADAQFSIDVFVSVLKSIGFNIDDGNWPKIYEHCRPYLDDVLRPVNPAASLTTSICSELSTGADKLTDEVATTPTGQVH